MDTKICFKCGVEKSLEEFHKHKQMKDGRLNKCKVCARKDVKKNAASNMKKEGWYEKEKARHRDKYFRLGYKEKHKPSKEAKREAIKRYHEKYPEKRSAQNKSSHLRKDGLEKHHWSYNTGDEKDVLWMTKLEHSALHRFLKYNSKQKVYETLEGSLLDSKLKHEEYFDLVKKSF